MKKQNKKGNLLFLLRVGSQTIIPLVKNDSFWYNKQSMKQRQNGGRK